MRRFLGRLPTGPVMLGRSSAVEWQSDVAREVTIQVRPLDSKNLDAEVVRAVELARAVPGVGEVRAYTKEESAGPPQPSRGRRPFPPDLPRAPVIVGQRSSRGGALAPLEQVLG